MTSIMALAAYLYAPITTAQYFATMELRLRQQCHQSVVHKAKLPAAAP